MAGENGGLGMDVGDATCDRSHFETVRSWAQENNKLLSEKELVDKSIHYLVKTANFRTRTISLFIEDFQNDPGTAQPHLKMFLAAPASSLAVAFGI